MQNTWKQIIFFSLISILFTGCFQEDGDVENDTLFKNHKPLIGVVVLIVSSPAINNINKTTYTVSGICSDNGSSVAVNIGSVATSDTCTALIWSVTVNISGDADTTTLAITADHNDAAGKSATQATASVVKDTINPTVAITSSPAINNTNQTAYTVSGTCSENGVSVSVNIGSVATSGSCTALAWLVMVNISGDADTGTLAITADHNDAAWNSVAQTAVSIVKYTVDPLVAITSSPAINNLNKTAYTVTGTCSENGVSVMVNIGSVATSGTCTALAWSVTVNISGDTDSATLVITADHNDAVGNTAVQAAVSVVKDTVLPTIISISTIADATYYNTNSLDFIVNYNYLVNVVGSPRMAIDIGGSTLYANYISGSGSTALTFRYTVEPGHSDTNGIILQSPIELNGGTMKSVSLADAERTFSAPATTGVLIDSILYSGIDILISVMHNEGSAYSLLAGTTTLCAGSSINGDIGSGGAITQTSCVPSGGIHFPVAAQPIADLTASYNALLAEPCDTPLLAGTLEGVTLAPGVHCFAAAATTTGTLTLNGPADAVWIIKSGGAFSSTSFNVVMTGGAQPCNVYWGITGAFSATGSTIQGSVIAFGAISATGTDTAGDLLGMAAVSVITGSTVAGCPKP